MVGWSSTSTEHKGSSFDGLCLRWYPCLITEHSTQPQICPDITVCVSPCQGFSKRLWTKPLQGCDPLSNYAISSRRSGLLLGEGGSQLHPYINILRYLWYECKNYLLNLCYINKYCKTIYLPVICRYGKHYCTTNGNESST